MISPMKSTQTHFCIIIETFVCHKDHITTKLLVVQMNKQVSVEVD